MSAALAAWRGALGGEHVLADPATLAAYTANVSSLRRAVPAVLRPATTNEVQRVVAIANQHRVALYPISRGKNWGMGSRLPVRDGAAIVDLSRMNRIREVNTTHAYAVVEPGVTQGQLHQHLKDHALPFFFNVTGSGMETSLIGNALERGVGYFSSRAEALSGLEVVLGNGQILHTGNGHFATSATTHLYKYGLGPYLDGLFAQSNYGIVTAAGMELIPRREAHLAILAKIADPARLGDFVQALVDLRKQEIVRSAIHIANRNRTVSVLGPLVQEQLARDAALKGQDLRALAERVIQAEGFGPWSAVGGVQGSPAELREVVRATRRALAGIAQVTLLDDARLTKAMTLTGRLAAIPFFRRKRIMVKAVAPLYGLAKGIPTDQPLKSAYWCAGQPVPEGPLDPDQGRCGFLYCLPMIPMSGTDAVRAVALTEQIFGRQNFESYVTLNTVNSKVLEGVINLVFDRADAARVEAAHACIDELEQRFLAMGFTPYRLGIQSMARIVDAQDPFWQTVRDLKQIFDPHHIIAPGRYNLI